MIYVTFSDMDEFLTELENEASAQPDTREKLWSPDHDRHGDVERGIVRYTSRMHAPSGPETRFIQRVTFVAGFIAGDSRLVELEAPCGAYWSEPLDENAYEQVTSRAKALEASIVETATRLGLEIRNGAFRIAA